MIHIWQEICQLPRLQEGMVGLQEDLPQLDGGRLRAKNLKEKCVNDDVRKVIGNIEKLYKM
jgi:hypothetical protein